MDGLTARLEVDLDGDVDSAGDRDGSGGPSRASHLGSEGEGGDDRQDGQEALPKFAAPLLTRQSS